MPMIGRRPITETEVAAVKEGKTLRLYVWGRIRYDDGFGQRVNVRFCRSYNPTGKVWNICDGNEM
jgi:hypothetical protein